MKAEQVSEHIWSLQSWLLLPCRVWLVAEPDGVTLVDAGMPFMAKGILAHLERLQLGSLKQILLTHGHSDHVGSIKHILEHHQVPVYAHEIEIPYMTGERIYPRRKKAEFNVKKGLALSLPQDEQEGLAAVGSLRPYFTPGHSPGHVVYYHEQDRVMLGGDLFTSKAGKLHRPMPMFTADMGEAVRSSEILRQLHPLHLEVCHGKPVKNPEEQLDAYLEKMGAAPIPTGV